VDARIGQAGLADPLGQGLNHHDMTDLDDRANPLGERRVINDARQAFPPRAGP